MGRVIYSRGKATTVTIVAKSRTRDFLWTRKRKSPSRALLDEASRGDAALEPQRYCGIQRAYRPRATKKPRLVRGFCVLFGHGLVHNRLFSE